MKLRARHEIERVRTIIGTTLLAVVTVMMSVEDAPAVFEPIAFRDIAGWTDDTHAEAFSAFRRGCEVISPAAAGDAAAAMRAVCIEAISLAPDLSDLEARRFFETRFEPRRVVVPGVRGLFTGYFEPILEASRTYSSAFPVPILGAPPALVSLSGKAGRDRLPAGFTHGMMRAGVLQMAPARSEINAGALAGEAQAIAWLADPVDAFFLHIQGSGRLHFRDGTSARVSYAGKNGHPYTSIGRVLVERGIMSREDVTMDSLRAWLAADRERATALMNENRSYIFFREVANEDPSLGPIGQLQAHLTPGRSLAVDQSHYQGNQLIWLDTTVPDSPVGPGGRLRRLMVAQDTGSAIRGPVRGDIFFGSGPAAGAIAGRMRADGSIVILAPRCQEC